MHCCIFKNLTGLTSVTSKQLHFTAVPCAPEDPLRILVRKLALAPSRHLLCYIFLSCMAAVQACLNMCSLSAVQKTSPAAERLNCYRLLIVSVLAFAVRHLNTQVWQASCNMDMQCWQFPRDEQHPCKHFWSQLQVQVPEGFAQCHLTSNGSGPRLPDLRLHFWSWCSS